MEEHIYYDSCIGVIIVYIMKKIIKTLVVFILSCILISTNCINSMAYHDLPYFKRHYGKGSNSHYNVKIDGIYYNILLYGKNKKGKEVYSVEATYAYANGKVLKIPNKIKFKGKQYKVKNVSFYEPAMNEEAFGAKLYEKITQWKFSLPYETIYLPKYATQFSWNRKTMKAPNFKKIYIGSKIKSFDLESSIYDMPKLKVIIDKKNPYIKMKNGAVYSKNGKEMYCLINSKKKYKIANGTKSVEVGPNKILETVILPSSVENLSDFAFSDCKKIKSVKFNKKLKVIEDFAFQKCQSLNNIVLPKKIDKIGLFAFKDCINLSKVTLEREKRAPIIERASFKNTKNGIQFIVKKQTVADQLKEQLNGSKVKNAKILVGKKVVYKNING